MAKTPGERTPPWWVESRVPSEPYEPPPFDDDEPPYDPEYDGPMGDPGAYSAYQPEPEMDQGVSELEREQAQEQLNQKVSEQTEPYAVDVRMDHVVDAPQEPGGYATHQPEPVVDERVPETDREQTQEQLNQKVSGSEDPQVEPVPSDPEPDTRDWARRVYEEHMADQAAAREAEPAVEKKKKRRSVEEVLSAKWDARLEREAAEKETDLRRLKNNPRVSQFYRNHPKVLRLGKDGLPTTPGQRVQREIALARQDHINQLKMADHHAAKRDRDDRLSEISEESRLFITVRLSTMSRDLYSGQMSLRSGLMSFAFMYMVNKDFRNLVNGVADQSNPQTLYNKHMLEKLETKRNDAVVKGEFLSEDESMKLRELRARVHYGRAPYDAYSAGMTEIALTSNCYERLREPGADQEKVLDEHRRDVARLYEMAGQDGIPAHEVARNARIIASEMIHDNPAYRAVFDQSSHDQLRPAVDLSTMPLDRMGLRQYGDWNGEMVTRDGQVLRSGSLTVRPVLSKDDHIERISDHVSSQILASTTPDQLYERMRGYLLGAADYDRMELNPHDFDKEAVKVFEQSNLHMFQMEQDGMDYEERTDAYAFGMERAMSKVAQAHPELDQAFQSNFGKDWPRLVRRFAKDPADFMARMEADRRAYEQQPSEPAPTEQPYAPEPPRSPEVLEPAPQPQQRLDEPEMSF